MRYTDFTRKEMLTQGNADQKKEIEVGAGLDGLRGADGGSKTSRNRCQVPERVKARCDRQQAKHSVLLVALQSLGKGRSFGETSRNLRPGGRVAKP